MLNWLLMVSVILVGIYFLITASNAFRKSKIVVNDEVLLGKKARFISLIFIIIGCTAIILPLIMVLLSNY